jgi:hypothetical protein
MKTDLILWGRGRWRCIRRDAEYSPDPAVEMERLERAIQEIARHVEPATRPTFRQEIKVATWSDTEV